MVWFFAAATVALVYKRHYKRHAISKTVMPEG